MSRLVNALHPRTGHSSLPHPNFQVLAGVVDGLSPAPKGGEMQHGFSVLFGRIGGITPDLWPQSANERQTTGTETEPSHLTVMLGGPGSPSLTVPLANTLFQTGRRSTLLASEWSSTRSRQTRWFDYKLVRSAEKRHAVINVFGLTSGRKTAFRVPLLPITHPRKILEGLGNILAKVDIDGQPAPASQELQANIPRWLEVLRSQVGAGHVRGVGVWALVIPKHLVENVKLAPEVVLDVLKSGSQKFKRILDSDRLGPGGGKLAFEMSTDMERVSWEASPMLKVIFQHGGHLHKICKSPGLETSVISLLSLHSKRRRRVGCQIKTVVPRSSNQLRPGNRGRHLGEIPTVILQQGQRRRSHRETRRLRPVLRGA